MEKNIAVIKGDGIGPEIVNEAINIIIHSTTRISSWEAVLLMLMESH